MCHDSRDHQWLEWSERGTYWNHRGQYRRIWRTPSDKIGSIGVNSKMYKWTKKEYINVCEFEMRWGKAKKEKKNLKNHWNHKNN